MKFITLCAPALLLFAASCGNSEKSNPISEETSHYYDSIRVADSIAENAPPVELDFTAARDKANDKKRVIIEGYVATPSVSYTSDKSVQIDFIERPNEFGTSSGFIASMNVGKGNNTMLKIPEKYRAEDIKVTGNSGEAIRVGDHVRMTGRLSVNDSYCSIDCEKIEKIEPVKVDYEKLTSTKLSAANMGDKGTEDHLVFAEGTIDTPMMTMGGDYTFVYLDLDGSRESRVTLNLQYGETPDHLEPLPENASDKDWKIHNDEGEVVSLKKKVRVYGVWHSGSLYVESIENI